MQVSIKRSLIKPKNVFVANNLTKPSRLAMKFNLEKTEMVAVKIKINTWHLELNYICNERFYEIWSQNTIEMNDSMKFGVKIHLKWMILWNEWCFRNGQKKVTMEIWRIESWLNRKHQKGVCRIKQVHWMTQNLISEFQRQKAFERVRSIRKN